MKQIRSQSPRPQILPMSKSQNENIQNCNSNSVLSQKVTRSFNLSEENRLWMSEDGVLRRIFGPKGEEGVEKWGKKYESRLVTSCTF